MSQRPGDCWRRLPSGQLMLDPAGLPFCVVPDSSGTLNDGNAQRWE